MFKVGNEVVYGLHGKCVITDISTKELDGAVVGFYQIRAIKNPIMAKTQAAKTEAAILVPVNFAAQNGLRSLMNSENAEIAIKLLAEPDYHFDLSDTNWIAKQKMLEEIIRKEGYIGLTKAVGHLHVMLSRHAVPPATVQKFFDNVYRLFAKELGEAMALQTKDVETIINRALRSKLAQDN